MNKRIKNKKMKLSFKRKYFSYFMIGLLFICTVLAAIPLGLIFRHVLINGLPKLNLDFFTDLPLPLGEVGGGMANAVTGSLMLVGLASVLSIPIGVIGGVYLSEYAETKLSKLFRLAIDMLNTMPSVVIGLFVYTVVVMPLKTFSALAGSLALTLIMLPVIVKTTEEVLRLVPDHIREAALALGISRWKVIVFVVLRGSISGIMTGILLAVARISGETAPLLLTAFGSRDWAKGMLQPIASLPVMIYNYSISPYEDWHKFAWTGALVLLLFVFFLNLITRLYLARR